MGTTQSKNNAHLDYKQQFVVVDSTEIIGTVGERGIIGAVGERSYGVTGIVGITFDDRKRQHQTFRKWFRQTAMGAMMDKIKKNVFVS